MATTFLIGIDPGVKHFGVAVCDTRTDRIIYVVCADISRDENDTDDSASIVDFDKLHIVLRDALNVCQIPIVVDLSSDSEEGAPPPGDGGLSAKRTDVKAIVENQYASTVHQFPAIEVRGACFAFMSAFRVPACSANSRTKFKVFGVNVPNKKGTSSREEFKRAAQGFMDEWIARVTEPGDLLRLQYWGAPDKPLPTSQHQRHDMADAMMMVLAASRTQVTKRARTQSSSAPR